MRYDLRDRKNGTRVGFFGTRYLIGIKAGRDSLI